ncbi:MAG TPA: SpoIID/LytB domain-containing protein, partial [Kineosporiaceae bacterium]
MQRSAGPGADVAPSAPRRARRRAASGGRARTVAGLLGGSLLAGSLGVSASPAGAEASVHPVTVRAAARGSGEGPGSGVTDGLVTVTGSGFGHGVGMSQYGAYGMARAGASAPEILRHYFTGTTVEGYPDAVDARVNVVDRGTRVALSTVALAPGGGRFELLPSDGAPVQLAAGDVAVVTPQGDVLAVAVTRADGTASTFASGALGVRWSGARAMPGPASVLQVDSRGAVTKSRQYRWGSLSLASLRRGGEARIEANALLDLHDEYLRGIAEVPSGWPDAALQAQVVAARNYALTHVGHPLAGCGGCVLWDDTRSQVYRGWEHESEPGGRRWLAAVTATQTSRTRGLAVLYQGAPITAYYSSSTGGRTRDAASVWGSAVPYLRSVDDRWSRDAAINPRYAAWTRTVPVSRLLAAFGLPDLAALTVTSRDAGGAVVTLQATSSDGGVRTLPGSVLRGTFGLPAQWVTSLELA